MKKVLQCILAIFVLLAGIAYVAYRQDEATAHEDSFIPPEWVMEIGMFLHLTSPNDTINEMPLVRWIFDFGTGAIHPFAQADVALRYGANIDAHDPQGWTALMDVSSYGGADTVKYLLAHGANPNLENKDGDTALSLDGSSVVRGDTGDRLNVAWQLLAAGADPCHRNHKGEMPAMHFGLNTPLGHMLDEVCKERATAK